MGLPERYGPWTTVYSRFCKWRDDFTFLRIFQALNEDADMENLSFHSTIVKAHPHSAGAKVDLWNSTVLGDKAYGTIQILDFVQTL